MTRDEIIDYVMKDSKGKSGLAAVGPIIDQLVDFVAWQHDQIADLQKQVNALESKQ